MSNQPYVTENLKRLRDDPSRVVILGGGRGGEAMVEMLCEETLVEIIAVVDLDEQSAGIQLAKSLGIQTYADVAEALVQSAPCVAFNLTGNEMVEEVAAGILGVGGVIGGLEARLMWRMVTDLKEAKKDMEFQARHDVLTNLVNRRYMIEQIEQEIDRCKRYGVECSLMMIDLDHFKRVNDEHGHAAGDEVLKETAKRIGSRLRGADVLARWGGEEFLVLLPHTGVQSATIAGEKCLQTVQEKVIKTSVHCELSVSFSAGVASFHELEAGLSTQLVLDGLLALADRRLYRAKANGRAQIVNQS